MLLGATSLCGQIRQSDNLRAEQIVTEQRLRQQMRQEEQQHQAQLDQMQRIDQQQAADQQAAAAQQAAPPQQLPQRGQEKAQDQDSTPVFAPPVQTQQTVAPPPQPVVVPQWSWKNFTLRDDIGLAALGLLLGALAFKAGMPLRNRS